MTAPEPKFDSFECPTFEIAAYIDGELDREREVELEQHFSVCDNCASELNLQKQFLCSLNSSLMNEIELPANFASTIVANAESSVAGLRQPGERFNAVFICIALLLFGLFALGADAGSFFGRLTDLAEQTAAVLGVAGRIGYSFLIGVGVVLRTLGGQVQHPAAVTFILFAAFVAIIFVFSRNLLRIRRT